MSGVGMREPIQICRGFTDEQWRGLRKKKDDGDESAWSCAIQVFERRISERFFACIEALIDADSKRDFKLPPGAPPDCSTLPSNDGRQAVVPGFAILALCCLLAETLQGFRESSPKKLAVRVPCSYPTGQCIRPSTTSEFSAFLRRPGFRGEFDDSAIARRFVDGVRNGIFHEANTRGWVIRRNKPRGRILAQEADGYALNRSEFCQALKAEFNLYLKELRDPSNTALRSRFKKKMNGIAKTC
jgi:hypothetical protein